MASSRENAKAFITGGGISFGEKTVAVAVGSSVATSDLDRSYAPPQGAQDEPGHDFFIVGIGASAGGLEARRPVLSPSTT